MLGTEGNSALAELGRATSSLQAVLKHLYGAFFLDITGFFAFSVVGCPIP